MTCSNGSVDIGARALKVNPTEKKPNFREVLKMSSMIRLAFLIGAVLIVTASLVIHRSETAFAQIQPICFQCNVLSTDEVANLRDLCDSLAGGIGILRPLNVTDSTEGLPRCIGGPTACEFLFVGMPTTWLCLGF